MLTKRSIAAVIIFSIITCGIYMIYWTFVTCDALQREGGKTAIPPILTTLLMLFVTPVGGALLGLDADDNINSIKAQRGLPVIDNKILWVVLGVLIPIVTMALVQYEINLLIDNPQNFQAPNAG